VTLEQQFFSLVLMFLGSLSVGFVFDGYRVFKGKVNLAKFIVFIIDVVFGIISALWIFFLLFWSNNGQLRIIMLAAFFVGLVVYYLTLSRLIIKLWIIVDNLIASVFKVIVKTLNLLIIKPLVALYRLFTMLLGFILTLISALVLPFKVLKTKLPKKEGFFSFLKKFKRQK